MLRMNHVIVPVFLSIQWDFIHIYEIDFKSGNHPSINLENLPKIVILSHYEPYSQDYMAYIYFKLSIVLEQTL